jgi:hypothetical protein
LRTAFSIKSRSFLLASRSQKLLLETFFPVRVTKFLWTSAIVFFFPQTENVEIKDMTISKRWIFFPVESGFLLRGFCEVYLI